VLRALTLGGHILVVTLVESHKHVAIARAFLVRSARAIALLRDFRPKSASISRVLSTGPRLALRELTRGERNR
jgi:hypothetical protein